MCYCGIPTICGYRKIHQNEVEFMGKLGINHWRLLFQTAWLVVINSVLFGVPYFSTLPWANNIFWPNLSTRFIVNNPTTSFLFQIQSRLASGSETYYINIAVPLLVFTLLVTILGRAWCGWLCPIGYLQNLLIRLRKRLGIPYMDISPRTTMVLNQMAYVLIFLISFISLAVGLSFLGVNHFFSRAQLPFESVAPPRPIAVFLQQVVGLESWETQIPVLSIIIASIIIALSFKIRHFWCRICPAGALMSLFNRRALLSIRKEGSKCTKCRVCLRACPMDIEEIYEEKESDNVTHPTCIHCYRCIELCPEDDCLSLTFLNKTIITSKYPITRGGGP
jgi:polyferredoxin